MEASGRDAFSQLILRGRSIDAERPAEIGEGLLQTCAGANEHELRFGEIDFGETHIDLRFELGLAESGDLIGEGLARGYRFLRDAYEGLGLQDSEVRAIDFEHDVVNRCLGGLRGGLRLKLELATRFPVRPKSVISWLTTRPSPWRLNSCDVRASRSNTAFR